MCKFKGEKEGILSIKGGGGADRKAFRY